MINWLILSLLLTASDYALSMTTESTQIMNSTTTFRSGCTLIHERKGSIALSPCGKFVLQSLVLYAADTGERIITLKNPDCDISKESLTFSPTSDHIIARANNGDSKVIIWNRQTGGFKFFNVQHYSPTTLCPSGIIIAAKKSSKFVQLLTIPDGKVLHTLNESDFIGWPQKVFFCHDSAYVATAAANKEKLLFVWDTRTGKKIATIPGSYALFNSSNTELVVAHDKFLKFYPMSGFFERTSVLLPKECREFKFNTDGTKIALFAAINGQAFIGVYDSLHDKISKHCNPDEQSKIIISPTFRYFMHHIGDSKLILEDTISATKSSLSDVCNKGAYFSEDEIYILILDYNTACIYDLAQRRVVKLINCQNELVHARLRLQSDFSVVTAPLNKTTTQVWLKKDSSEEITEDTSCAICLESLQEKSIVDLSGCNHRNFCSSCLQEWRFKKNKRACPLCRAPINNFRLLDMVHTFKKRKFMTNEPDA